MIKIPAAGSVPGENPLSGLQIVTFLLCPHMAGREREEANSLVSL